MWFAGITIFDETKPITENGSYILAHFTVLSDGTTYRILGNERYAPTEVSTTNVMQEWVAFAHWAGYKVIYGFYPANTKRNAIFAHVNIRGCD